MCFPSCRGIRTKKTAFIIIGINLAGKFATATTWLPKSHVVLDCQKQDTFRSLFDNCKEIVITSLPKSVPKTPSEICLPKPANDELQCWNMPVSSLVRRDPCQLKRSPADSILPRKCCVYSVQPEEYHATMGSCSDKFHVDIPNVLVVLTVCAWYAVYPYLARTVAIVLLLLQRRTSIKNYHCRYRHNIAIHQQPLCVV
jgi:hypothetical protein